MIYSKQGKEKKKTHRSKKAWLEDGWGFPYSSNSVLHAEVIYSQTQQRKAGEKKFADKTDRRSQAPEKLASKCLQDRLGSPCSSDPRLHKAVLFPNRAQKKVSEKSLPTRQMGVLGAAACVRKQERPVCQCLNDSGRGTTLRMTHILSGE